jgi:hypothetical protein
MFSARSSTAKVQPGLPPRKPPSKTASSSKLVVPPKLAGASSIASAKEPPAYAGWKEAFEAGVAAYKTNEYEAALKAFDAVRHASPAALDIGGRARAETDATVFASVRNPSRRSSSEAARPSSSTRELRRSRSSAGSRTPS